MRKLLAAALLALLPLAAHAGDKPLVLESGQTKVLPAGTTLQLNASGSGAASINLGSGSAPSSPNNGDCWITTSGLFCRYNGSTVGPFGTGTGTGSVTTTGSPASGNLSKFSGATSITNGDLSGDCTTSGTLAITCTKTNGTSFATSATTDTTNASNISSGTLGSGRLPNPSASTLGGIESLASSSHNFINQISTSGVPSAARPACADLSDSAASCSTDATNASNIGSGTLAAGRIAANVRVRDFGTTFGDTGGSALTSGSVVYFTVPYACTIAAWNIAVDAGTVTFDIWKIATGTAVPTVSNTITASAKPALSTGTALHSTSMSGWTTSVTANDIFGIQLNTVATAKYAELDVECDQ